MRTSHTRLRRFLISALAAAVVLSAASLVAVAAPGSGGSKPAPGGASAQGEASARVAATASRRHSKRGPRGKRGKRGPQGKQGAVGAQGPVGPQGAQGQQGSQVLRQSISIGWQNNAWQGQDTQKFVAPGIGAGNVTCRPPYDNGPSNREPNGTQWVQLFPDDSTGSVAETTMWTTRFGGPPADRNTTVVREAKLLNTFYGPSFYEGMNTQPTGVDPESQGMFVGIISSRTKTTGSDLAPPTTFVLSWHWNFTSEGQNRCYVTGNFYTRR